MIAALHDQDKEVRIEAARALEAQDSPEAIKGLLNALEDTEQFVREAAAQSLSAVKNLDVAPLLVEWTGHVDAGVRIAIFRALRELRLPAATKPALKALSDEDARVRREAVAVLGWLKDHAALPQLVILAKNDPDAEVRRAAVGALGFAADDTVRIAIELALFDLDWQVREEAAAVAGKLGLQELVPSLILALNDSYCRSGRVRR